MSLYSFTQQLQRPHKGHAPQVCVCRHTETPCAVGLMKVKHFIHSSLLTVAVCHHVG